MQGLGSDPRDFSNAFESSSRGMNAQDANYAVNDVFSKSFAQPPPPLVSDDNNPLNSVHSSTNPNSTSSSSSGANSFTNSNLPNSNHQNPGNPSLDTVNRSSSSTSNATTNVSHQSHTSGLVSLSSYSSYSSPSVVLPNSGDPSGVSEGGDESANASETEEPKLVISYERIKPVSKKKLPSFRHFTRKGVEYILRTPLRRGMPKPTDTEVHPTKRCKSGQRGAMWAEDVVAYLQGKADEETNDLVVSDAQAITKKVVRELRDKLMIDEEGVIRTKRAFHYNARVAGSVLIWPEEVKVVMRHKFMEFGSLSDIEGFFEQFWSWYQPRYATEELEFRRNLTEHVYEFDEISRLENEEQVLAQRLEEVRSGKLKKIAQIQAALKASPLGGELKSLSDMRYDVEKNFQKNPNS